jgi:hypothetical protein
MSLEGWLKAYFLQLASEGINLIIQRLKDCLHMREKVGRDKDKRQRMGGVEKYRGGEPQDQGGSTHGGA